MASWIAKVPAFQGDVRPHIVIGRFILLYLALFSTLESRAQVQAVEVDLDTLTKTPSRYSGQTVRLRNVSVKRLRSSFSDALSSDTVRVFATPAERSYSCLYLGPAANLRVKPVQDERWTRLSQLEANETGQITITALVDTEPLLMKRPRKFRYPRVGVLLLDVCWSRPTPPFWLDLLKVEDFSKAVDPGPFIPFPKALSLSPK